MEIKEIRELTGLSRPKFSNRYNIPLSTLRNWESDKASKDYRECPVYVKELLERVVKYDLEDIRRELEQEKQNSKRRKEEK